MRTVTAACRTGSGPLAMLHTRDLAAVVGCGGQGAIGPAVRPVLAGKPDKDNGAWDGTANVMKLRTWPVNYLGQL